MSFYLDYAATTPIDPRVLEKMLPYLRDTSLCGNSSSPHFFGKIAKEAIESARSKVSSFLGVDSLEIVWTSGATESNNLAIKGVFEAKKNVGKHIITSAIEHKSILKTCLYLQEAQGADITFIRPDQNGIIEPQKIAEAIRPDTILISIMHVNNEVGTIQNIPEIGRISNNNGILFHVDAAQSLGKTELHVKDWGIDLLSLSAHKVYGPKGIGCLFIKNQPEKLVINCQIHGGGQENFLRSGTHPTHQIVGMGEALFILENEFELEVEKMNQLAKYLEHQLSLIDEVSINGDRLRCVPSIFNVSFPFVESEVLINSLDDISIANGSACTSEKINSSHVLQAMGLGRDISRSSVRISFGRYTSKNDLSFATERIKQTVFWLREKS